MSGKLRDISADQDKLYQKPNSASNGPRVGRASVPLLREIRQLDQAGRGLLHYNISSPGAFCPKWVDDTLGYY
jgi:hypothetical protein